MSLKTHVDYKTIQRCIFKLLALKRVRSFFFWAVYMTFCMILCEYSGKRIKLFAVMPKLESLPHKLFSGTTATSRRWASSTVQMMIKYEEKSKIQVLQSSSSMSSVLLHLFADNPTATTSFVFPFLLFPGPWSFLLLLLIFFLHATCLLSGFHLPEVFCRKLFDLMQIHGRSDGLSGNWMMVTEERVI